jgi:hypothetical protein
VTIIMARESSVQVVRSSPVVTCSHEVVRWDFLLTTGFRQQLTTWRKTFVRLLTTWRKTFVRLLTTWRKMFFNSSFCSHKS